jgi:hypothetical protein
LQEVVDCADKCSLPLKTIDSPKALWLKIQFYRRRMPKIDSDVRKSNKKSGKYKLSI